MRLVWGMEGRPRGLGGGDGFWPGVPRAGAFLAFLRPLWADYGSKYSDISYMTHSPLEGSGSLRGSCSLSTAARRAAGVAER